MKIHWTSLEDRYINIQAKRGSNKNCYKKCGKQNNRKVKSMVDRLMKVIKCHGVYINIYSNKIIFFSYMGYWADQICFCKLNLLDFFIK